MKRFLKAVWLGMKECWWMLPVIAYLVLLLINIYYDLRVLGSIQLSLTVVGVFTWMFYEVGKDQLDE